MGTRNIAGVDVYKTCDTCGKEFLLTCPASQYVWKSTSKNHKYYCCEACYNKRSRSMKDVLAQARELYGNKNQIQVSMEELAELIAVLAKYARYEQHGTAVAKLNENVLDEVADVTIILEHVKAIFELTEQDVSTRIKRKMTRLSRWMNDSTSFEQTTKDRTV